MMKIGSLLTFVFVLNRMVVNLAPDQFQDRFVETLCEELGANQQ